VGGPRSKTTNSDPPPPSLKAECRGGGGGGPIWILHRRSECADLNHPDLRTVRI
jgi:hypothetical protein